MGPKGLLILEGDGEIQAEDQGPMLLAGLQGEKSKSTCGKNEVAGSGVSPRYVGGVALRVTKLRPKSRAD